MKPTWVVGPLLLYFVCLASGQTYITSDITTSQVWGPAGSPYIIQADIGIINDSTLTIQSGLTAGVTVAFDDNCRLEADWGCPIIAQGTALHPVVFTSSSGSPDRGFWKWMTVGGPVPSSFSYCVFEYAETALRMSVSSSPISHCTVRHCYSSGLFCGSSSPVIQYCNIYDNRDGIAISTSAGASGPVIHFNNIHDNTNWNIWSIGCPEPHTMVNAENNWWGSSDEEDIAREILDSNDNPDLHVTIDYDPWWTQQPVKDATWTRIKSLFRTWSTSEQAAAPQKGPTHGRMRRKSAANEDGC
jgi:hypothetical protein